MLDKQISQEVGDTKKRAKIITVYSAKGGVGKTTISCELASYLALTEHGRDKFKVCIVDYNIDFGDVMGTLLYNPNKACMTLWADEIRGQLEREQAWPSHERAVEFDSVFCYTDRTISTEE